jgi:hypothetical protein
MQEEKGAERSFFLLQVGTRMVADAIIRMSDATRT